MFRILYPAGGPNRPPSWEATKQRVSSEWMDASHVGWFRSLFDQFASAVAEGSAGGLISAALLAVPGASAYFVGGAVVYTGAARSAFTEVSMEDMKGLRPASEPYAALLNQSTALARCNAPGFQDGVCTTQRRMSGKRKLATRCENPQAIVRVRCRGRKDKRRFRKVGPSCDSLHRVGGEALRVQYHGHRIAQQRLEGKDVNDFVGSLHVPSV